MNSPAIPRRSLLLLLILALLSVLPAVALPTRLGDLDEDGVPTILDVALLTAHFRGTHPLPLRTALFADMNQDGVLNEADQEALANEILLLTAPRPLPLTGIRETSPARGEGNVAVTRETIIHFSQLLSPFTSIDTARLHADFGGRKILSCVDLAADRKKVTLFYMEPLPSNARVIVTFDGNGINDLLDRPIDADGDGQPGGVFTTEFETISITPVPNTGIRGTVFASERGTGGGEVPLAGVTITVDGAEESLRCVTGPDGKFELNPCPSGSFFVHIDGRTSPLSSYPGGDYYPSVGKKWHASPGRLDNPAGDIDDTPQGGGTGIIYLPCICSGSLETVSPSQETVITFPPAVIAANPALAGTEIRVPANALFADDGTRGGKVGIAPVAPDRIPSPLPPGLNPAMVFTIQSDGATNFDRPVPVSFPNLPHPVTGVMLEPGAKSALFSFNHDIGEWEIAGSMTVSEDGLLVTTDPGVGVQQPGWHTTQPGVRIRGRFVITDCGTTDYAEDAGAGLSELIVSAEDISQDIKNFRSATSILNSSNEWYFDVKIFADRYKNIPIPDFGPVFGAANCVIEAMAEAAKNNRNMVVSDFANADCLSLWLDTMGSLAIGCPPLALAFKAAALAVDLYDFQSDLLETAENIGAAYAEPLVECDPAVQARIAQLQGKLNVMGDSARSMASVMEQFPENAQERFLASRDEILHLMNGSATADRSTVGQAFILSVEIIRYSAALTLMGRELDRFDSALSDVKVLAAEFDEAVRGVARKANSARISITFQGVTQRRVGTSFDFIAPAETGVGIFGVEVDGFRVGHVSVRTGKDGETIHLRDVVLRVLRDALDEDSDGIPDRAEEIAGYRSDTADSDNDGINDAAEFTAGDNMLLPGGFSGSAAQATFASSAMGLTASSRALAVACGSEGTAFLSYQGNAAPVMRTRLPAASIASSVSLGADICLVAESDAGFRCVALDDQLNVESSTHIPVPGRAISTVASGSIGYGGTSTGSILEMDLASGGVLRQLETGPGEIEDLAVQGDWLFARKPDRLLAIQLPGTAMAVAGELVLSSGRTTSLNRLRISLADGRVFCTKGDGCQVVSTAGLPVMTLAGTITGPGDNWRHFVPNGRTGVLAGKVQTSGNVLAQLPIPASLFTIPASGDSAAFATSFDMPGFANAVALNRGLAYVSCDNGTLAVVNYLDFDRLRQPPSVTLSSSVNLAVPVPQVIEGSVMRLSAAVADDVQVGNVEFHVDGLLAFDDGAYPFEHRFIAPRRSSLKTTFKVRARAIDTGGNAAWSTEYEISLLPDTAPPAVRSFLPAAGTMNRSVTNVYVRFSELMDPATLTSPAFTLTAAGADGILDTADDLQVPYFLVYRDADSLTRLALDAPLPPGWYRMRAAPPVADATGNVMATAAESVFRVYSLADADDDGIPDDWEPLLGSDPALADSDGDGIPDGLEDRDGDGTPDGVEIVRLGQDPRIGDANSNGTPDGLEDSDSDGFLDHQEAVAGTSIFNSDTDGDGLDDGTESASGLNPLVSNLSPLVTAVSPPATVVNAARGVTPVIAAPVQSAPVSTVNAGAEITPVIATPVRSAPASFLNFLPAATPVIPVPVQSGPVSFQNNPPPSP